MARILTTVVGSYPLPEWLSRAPSEQALIDATRVVIATQENAGIDVVCDGELYRFDVNHPEKLAHAIAEVLAEQAKHLNADVVQIDEANLPGHPDEWQWAAAAINKVLRAVPKKSKAAVHLCFGNYGGQSIQKGTWAKLMDYLNALKADHIVMETAHRPPQELEVFKELRREIGLGLGVVDIKRTEIESPSEVARSIERADKVLGKGRVKYIHPDCGFWMLPRNVADGKIRVLAAGRDLYEGR